MPPRTPTPRLTHFLCIPLVTPSSRNQLQNSLAAFKADVTSGRTPENPDGISEKAIRPLGTLHLTLGVMSLVTKEQVDNALNLLNSLNLKDMLSAQNSKAINNQTELSKSTDTVSKGKAQGTDEIKSKSLVVTLRGLTSMHAPSKTSILYSVPIDEDFRLQSFCLKLKEAFAAVDLLVPDTRPLLLHATIVNTIYVPGVKGKGSGHGKTRAKLTIDARDILEKYKDFEWMKDVMVEKLAICKMGAQKMEDGNEEYVVEGEVEVP